jgi:hypothetical protein
MIFYHFTFLKMLDERNRRVDQDHLQRRKLREQFLGTSTAWPAHPQGASPAPTTRGQL